MNKDKYEDSIRMATNERLAEMLETYNQWRRWRPPYDKVLSKCPFEVTLIGEMLDEAARRLRFHEPMMKGDEQ